MRNQCPVCHMTVEPDHLPLVYQDMHFAFCSEQCRERFAAKPHLYIGVPTQQAPRQQGTQIVKRRSFGLEEPLSTEQARRLSDAVGAMMGIRQVRIEGREIHISYDLLEATAEQIERTLVEAGAHLGGGWKERLQRALVHYTEEWETASLEVSPNRHSHHH